MKDYFFKSPIIPLYKIAGFLEVLKPSHQQIPNSMTFSKAHSKSIRKKTLKSSSHPKKVTLGNSWQSLNHHHQSNLYLNYTKWQAVGRSILLLMGKKCLTLTKTGTVRWKMRRTPFPPIRIIVKMWFTAEWTIFWCPRNSRRCFKWSNEKIGSWEREQTREIIDDIF